jgi:putative redox protein
MAVKTVQVHLDQIGAVAFEATGVGSGGKLVVDGAPDIGGEGRGQRPMELMLSSLASCSAMDVVTILRKQKEPLEHLRIEIEGDRADAIPSPFTAVRMTFIARGPVNEHKLNRAVGLAVEKYCSASATIKNVPITWTARLET